MVVKCYLSHHRIWNLKKIRLIRGIDGKPRTVNKTFINKYNGNEEEIYEEINHFNNKFKYLIDKSFEKALNYCNKIYILETITEKKHFISYNCLVKLYTSDNKLLLKNISKKKYYGYLLDFFKICSNDIMTILNTSNKKNVSPENLQRLNERVRILECIEMIFRKEDFLEEASEVAIFMDNVSIKTNYVEVINKSKVKEKPKKSKSEKPKPKGFETKVNNKKTIETESGIKVQSQGEKRIADFLHKNNISFDYDEQMTLEGNERNKNGYKTNWVRPDFYLSEFNVVIEYWGMEGEPDYDNSMKKKKRLYKESKTRLIELRKEDLRQLETKLADKLSKMGFGIENSPNNVNKEK